MTSVAYEALLRQDGQLVTHVVGTSMRPLLRDRQSIVIVEDVRRVPPRKGDVVLYKTGETYVLHRILRINGEMCLIRGDSTWYLEQVPREALLATMTGFYRRPEGRLITPSDPGYRLYRLALPAIRWTRRIGSKARRVLLGRKKS